MCLAYSREHILHDIDCMFWRLLRAQRFPSQMSAFLVNGSLITKENDIRDMWADHFEALGTPTVNLYFDSKFADLISTHVQNILASKTVPVILLGLSVGH